MSNCKCCDRELLKGKNGLCASCYEQYEFENPVYVKLERLQRENRELKRRLRMVKDMIYEMEVMIND